MDARLTPSLQVFQGRFAGSSLKLLATLTRVPMVARLASGVLKKELGISALAELPASGPLEPDTSPRRARPGQDEPTGEAVEAPAPPPRLRGADSLTAAYAAGSASPEQIIEGAYRALDRISAQQPMLDCMLTRDTKRALKDASASAERWSQGIPRGPLDGVPFAVKEQVAVAGFRRRLGDTVVDSSLETRDATIVRRLRAAGAIVLGQTTMTEFGMSPVGINPVRAPLRNPHNLGHTAGGSSTGSGLAVALGLCPVAIGADGGGSIRIPAAMVGVFGLKPTFGYVSRAGDAFGGSLDHLGPIAGCTRDLALFMEAVAGRDPEDPGSLHAPASPPRFSAALLQDVKGLRIGIDEQQWQDCSDSIREAGSRALDRLVEAGAERVAVRLPLADVAAPIGYLTIAAETRTLAAASFARHRARFGLDMQAFLQITAQLDAQEYLRAQVLREQLRQQVSRTLRQVDVLALPTTASTALASHPTYERDGLLFAGGVNAMCRHTFLGNLTGLPAGTAPVGLDGDGLPMGLQILGDAWRDSTVLRVLAALERQGAARAARAPQHVDLLACT